MDIKQFSETIKNLYLPFTLRKMYYKELMLRKPLFVGTSKKNVGFNGDQQVINKRTCQGQIKQRINENAWREIYIKENQQHPKNRNYRGARTADPYDINSSDNYNMLQVVPVKFSQPKNQKKNKKYKKDNESQNLVESYVQGRVCQQMLGTRGDQGAQTELRNPGSVGSNSGNESNNKGIDMQSFGAMTGADPLAVKEIEQLMFNS